jgi:hypothetical protein
MSLRAYAVYKFLLENGYKPYAWQNLLFMLSPNAAKYGKWDDAWTDFVKLVHRKNLGFLPIAWGGERVIQNLKESGLLLEYIPYLESESSYPLDAKNVSVNFSTESLDGNLHDFLQISIAMFSKIEKGSFEARLYWADDYDKFSEEKSFVFKICNGSMLVPVGSSPFWLQSKKIKNIKLSLPRSIYNNLKNITITGHYYNIK